MTQIPGLFTRSSSTGSRQAGSLLGILGALGPAPAVRPPGEESRPERFAATSSSLRAGRDPADGRLGASRCGEAR